jgi:hypothetical protein
MVGRPRGAAEGVPSRRLSRPQRAAEPFLTILALRPGHAHARVTLAALPSPNGPDEQARHGLLDVGLSEAVGSTR